MTEWTPEELHAISEVEEIRLAPLTNDGTPRKPVIMWVVTDGTDVFVRSVLGTSAGWFRHVTASGRAHLIAADVDRDVAFEPVNDVLNQVVTDAYSRKYAGHGADLTAMVEGPSVEATLKVVPA